MRGELVSKDASKRRSFTNGTTTQLSIMPTQIFDSIHSEQHMSLGSTIDCSVRVAHELEMEESRAVAACVFPPYLCSFIYLWLCIAVRAIFLQHIYKRKGSFLLSPPTILASPIFVSLCHLSVFWCSLCTRKHHIASKVSTYFLLLYIMNAAALLLRCRQIVS